MHVGLAALIIMNLSIVARFTQLKHPFFIKWRYIDSLAFKAEYFDKKILKTFFVFITFYNIVCISIFEDYLPLNCLLWFLSIWWWDFFVSGKFTISFIISMIDLFGYSYLSHTSLFFIPTTLYFIYIVYLSTMYKIESSESDI